MMIRARNDRGSSLTEVMVCMVIVTLVATATTKGMVYSSDVVGENTTHQEAIVLAQQTVERLRTSSYDAIESGQSTSGDGRYEVVREVAPDTPEAGMKQITVTVKWTWKGQARTYELATIFAKLTKS
jgi:Tfp pilus assembly protein PilV